MSLGTAGLPAATIHVSTVCSLFINSGQCTDNQLRYRPTASASLRDRSTLIPEYYTPPSSGRSSPFSGGPNGFQPSGQRFADDLEGQNDEALEGLTAKVKMLKEVCTHVARE